MDLQDEQKKRSSIPSIYYVMATRGDRKSETSFWDGLLEDPDEKATGHERAKVREERRGEVGGSFGWRTQRA